MEISVIIPSRNRARLLRRAIDSVRAQNHQASEVIVVNDGSDGDEARLYAQIAAERPGEVIVLDLESSPRGHGPSYAINRGVEHASSEYVCFLDDDDCWIDPGHLARASHSLSADEGDLYFSNQDAYSGERRVAVDLWLNPLASHLGKASNERENGTSVLTVGDLMSVCSGRFAHLNNTIVRRELYLVVGGMDEYIRYECEWDLYLRLIAAAETILYNPTVVARHNVPDPDLAVNVSTGMPPLQKFLFRSAVLDKAVMFSPDPLIRRMAMKHKTYTLKKIAELLANEKKFEQALFYAREGRIRPWDIKWRLYTAMIASKAASAGR